MNAHDIITKFRLGGLWQCEKLKAIRLDGIYDNPRWHGRREHLDSLEDLGKWLMKGFLVNRGSKNGIEVDLVRRLGACTGDIPGERIKLSERDMDVLSECLKLMNGQPNWLLTLGMLKQAEANVPLEVTDTNEQV